MVDLIQAVGIFGDWRKHACCDCCNGYCTAQDSTVELGLYRLTFNGVAYLTDKHLAIREDLIGEAGTVTDRPIPEVWTLPEEQPQPSTQLLRALFVHRLHDYGITVHEGESGQRQHLYLNVGHVGWLMPIRWEVGDGPIEGPSMFLADLPTISETVPTSGHRWLIDGSDDPWDIAAGLLNASRMIGGA